MPDRTLHHVDRRTSVRTAAMYVAGALAIVGIVPVALAGRPTHPHYGETPQGISVAEGVAAGVAGAGLGVAAASVYGGRSGGNGGRGQDEDASNIKPLPETFGALTDSRLVVSRPTLEAGSRFAADLQVKLEDGNWYSATHRPETTFRVEGTAVIVAGAAKAKNVFSLPITAPQSLNGKEVSVIGQFEAPGAQRVIAKAQVNLTVPATVSGR
jgi:hypothetical protein